MSATLQDALSEPVITIALCWKLTRGDGLVLGFTSHDRDLRIDGVNYVARPGMMPSAVSQTDDLSGDSMETTGPINSVGISADDLESGRWANARVELFACDWRAPAAGRLWLVRGTLGAVTRTGFGFTESFRAELLSGLAQLEQIKPLRLSPTCRAELGDARCGIDMRLHRIKALASGWAGNVVTLAAPLQTPEHYAFGRMRWVTGPLAGVDRRIAAATAQKLILEEPLPELVTAAGEIWIWEGCDKRLVTCSQRFSNVLAFDGEPHVPGNDALVRYGDS